MFFPGVSRVVSPPSQATPVTYTYTCELAEVLPGAGTAFSRVSVEFHVWLPVPPPQPAHPPYGTRDGWHQRQVSTAGNNLDRWSLGVE